jgi:energy-coupling factor transporter transmembrane protein EcfT
MSVNFNPSVVLFSWGSLLLLLLALPWPWLGFVCLITLVFALAVAAPGLLGLLRRSRWLLAISLLMFGWLTPGMPVPWLPGATLDGLQQAAEQLSRLLASIAMVALLLVALDKRRLLEACYGLLAPLQAAGVDVERWVLRLALTLRGLETSAVDDSDGSRAIVLSRAPLQLIDYALLLALTMAMAFIFLGVRLL